MKFVIVDDDELDRYVVRRFLKCKESSVDLIEAQSGLVFIDEVCHSGQLQLADRESAVVLIDINLPGIDGFETVDRLEELMDQGLVSRELKVVMYSSSDNPSDRSRAETHPLVGGYIVKPLDDNSAASFLGSATFTDRP